MSVRVVRYSVAASLDGYIAGPKGEFDWIIMDPEIDFREFLGRFDTALIGARSYEAMLAHGEAGELPGWISTCFPGRCARRTTPR